jgi:hypothetical protein
MQDGRDEREGSDEVDSVHFHTTYSLGRPLVSQMYFPIDRGDLSCGKVASEWSFYSTRCPSPPPAIRARFGGGIFFLD